MYKRYQYFGKGGKHWTKWFEIKDSEERPKYQFGRKLLNEYSNEQK